jgi:hypothetical protein
LQHERFLTLGVVEAEERARIAELLAGLLSFSMSRSATRWSAVRAR